MKITRFTCLLIGMLFSATSAATSPPADPQPLPAPSSRAQKLYEGARDDLLQIRVLLKNGRTQSSVGSGFVIGKSHLVVTNYHVVSQIVMEPETYVGEYVDTHGTRGPVQLIAVDALHDLAVVKVGRIGTGFFNVPDALPKLNQGQYLYSMGNPLDLGFAISEGSYNGVIGRGFYNQLMFTGPINPGMSGGPNLTENGQVAGVNVSKRLDGESVSFLVPVEYVRDLLKTVQMQEASSNQASAQGDSNASTTTKGATGGNIDFKQIIDFKNIVGQQLLNHQNRMVDTVLSSPLNMRSLGNYAVPVRESDQMRCWGRSNNRKESPYLFNSIDCAMESAIFVSEQLQVGQIAIRHEYTKAAELDPIRFSALASASFKNEQFGNDKDPNRTGPVCHESFVTNQKLPMRAVLCVRAYRKFDGLYDFALLTASTDSSRTNLQSRIDANGVSYENGLRITKAFMGAIATQSSNQNMPTVKPSDTKPLEIKPPEIKPKDMKSSDATPSGMNPSVMHASEIKPSQSAALQGRAS